MKHFLKTVPYAGILFLFLACNMDTETEELPSAKLTAIEIAERPNITYYAKNQTFNAEGLKVKGFYDDETEAVLDASEYTVIAPDMNKSGPQEVTVQSGTLEAGFNIFVDPSTRLLESITLTRAPEKTAYRLGDDFDLAGLKITGHFTGGENREVNNAVVSVIDYDKTRAGAQTVRFRVNKSDTAGTAAVTVKVPSGAKVTVLSGYRQVYAKGEAFDAAHLQAKVTTLKGEVYTQSGGKGIYPQNISDYNPAATGSQTVNLTLEGASPSTFEVYVADTEPAVWFDYGYMRYEGDKDGKGAGDGKYYAQVNETLVLAPVRFLIGYGKDHKDTGVTYNWSANGGSGSPNGEYYTFKPTATGTYSVSVTVKGKSYVTGQDIEKTATATVVCYSGKLTPGTFNPPDPPANAVLAKPFVKALRNFAPGQFTEKGNGHGWSLGAHGGYQVWEVKHQAEYDIRGNPMGGWGEPGIVWVMEDKNGNGLPDEMWYELKGSDDGSASYASKITRRYGLTYFLPAGSTGEDNQYGQTIRTIFWLDAKGRSGRMNGGWPKDWGVTGNWVTFTGTLLRDDGNIVGEYGGLEGFTWGYVDTDTQSKKFKISNARRADGTAITLSKIRFAKVQNGVFRYGGSLGEISTELYGADGFGGFPDYGYKPQTDFPLP